ncbi:MAG: riboflavin synthase [Candidatus Eisenbacteria bacterium]|nr:riboflavin synthase [Candidatus Eisenbacteria bacterium]
MFTGLIEEIGEIYSARVESGGKRFVIQGHKVMEELSTGDSVSIGGVCLTVEKMDPAAYTFQVFAMKETLKRSNAGAWRKGTPVNLERALRLSARLGGHLVQGHVDGLGRLINIRRYGASRRLILEIPAELRRFIAEKGSIALDGVSLTIGKIVPRGCEIHLIPETLKRTTLGRLRSGEMINVEVDLMARYLLRFLENDNISTETISKILRCDDAGGRDH